MKFDLQTFLSEMRKEQKEDHDALSARVGAVLEKVSDHETRLVVVEKSQAVARWFGGAVVVGFIAFVFDLVLNHVPKLVGWSK